MKWSGILIAIIVVLATNAVVLTGVAISRHERPEARVELTENQLRLVPMDDENNGLSMRLIVDHPRTPYDRSWIDSAKLTALGFDTHVAPADPAAREFYRRAPGRQAFVVIEYQSQHPKPRLVAVDVGRDPRALRGQYPDTARFIITRGLVRLQWRENLQVVGLIPEILSVDIYVPLPYSRTVAAFAKMPYDEAKPRFKATLCYGQTYEPWICAVELIPPAAR